MKQKITLLLGLIIIISMNMVSAIGENVDTLPVHWVGHDAAVLKGDITNLGDNPNVTAFFQYKVTGEVDWINSTQTAIINTTGNYTLNIFELEEYTNYTYRAAIEGDVVTYSMIEETFKTSDAPDGTYTTTENEDNSVEFEVTITDLGNATNVTLYTECFGDENYFISENTTFNTTGTYTSTVTELLNDETYYCYPTMEWTYEGNDLLKQLTFKEILLTDDTTNVNEGINNIRGITFAAFGLIALIILVTIAMTIVNIFSNGTDTTQIMIIGIWAIGASIVLFIGYIIINAVANVLL